jgi:hypothetical protein
LELVVKFGDEIMVAIPPVILVFDISALSAASCSEWREFSRVGSCYIPQIIYEEMKLMFDRSPDPDLERIAKDFNRFYATSNWKITEADAHHSALKMGAGQSLTRRARVSLAVGRCAYGLSETFQTSIVVLVTKDRSLLQRLYEIPEVNLCGITGDALLQWSRSGLRPIAVIQKVQQFRTAHGMSGFDGAGVFGSGDRGRADLVHAAIGQPKNASSDCAHLFSCSKEFRAK